MKKLKYKSTKQKAREIANSNLPVFVQYYKLSKLAMELDWDSAEICADPMNGCPEDFAEDFDRKVAGIYTIIDSLDVHPQLRKIADRMLWFYFYKRNRQFNELKLIWNS